MREVTVSRAITAPKSAIADWLEPATIVDAEGSFSVSHVEDTADATVVVASGPGMELPLRFEEHDDSIYYTQEGDHGPFSHMETWIELTEESAGTIVTLRSSVSLAAPLPFGDRIAAWKRSGELRRAADALESAFE
ncbi:SRPBCC family protein [Natronolimnobius sp. AArcel1]|uniref:SRPBCC family protein n=1 Tax=Natronolimnobius sp. AArcel1 TaxID=1679093 RepID=UPI0013EC41E4|nr:SRPBCC family protein [Natronolimnobius sp. AArcel1]NGM67928.1 SRPBCC family protein [Natronolimnobius sp. AArcel1]